MKPQIKIRAEFHWELKDYFLTNLLSKTHNLKRVKTNPDITIGVVEPIPLTEEFKNSPIKILVAGENINYKINIFKALEYLTKKTSIKFNILNKILPRKFLNIKLGLIRKQYYDYIKKIAKDSPKGEYAIITNNLKGKNILNLPFFLQVKQITDNLNKLEKKKIININKKKKFCCIIISNESSFERIDFFKQLSKYKKVDCFGKTSLTNSNNSLLPKCWTENPKFLSQYKFVISFENSFEEDYITEKLLNTMLANSIPIYRGAPNISKYFNTDSFINYENCDKDYGKMIEKIIQLDSDNEKYKKFIKKDWMTRKNKQRVINKVLELDNFLNNIMSNK
ncbi:MAG: glycosyltransferase family 10 [archaeon]